MSKGLVALAYFSVSQGVQCHHIVAPHKGKESTLTPSPAAPYSQDGYRDADYGLDL